MMRLMVPLFLVSVLAAPGATPAAPEIEAVLKAFNSAVAANDSKRVVALFTEQGTYAGQPVAVGIRKAAPKRLPWDERMPLRITIQKIVFPKPNRAVVNATLSDSSPTLDTRTWSCVFVLVRVGPGWKISSYEESGPVHSFQ
jgi:hypothetical protein